MKAIPLSVAFEVASGIAFAQGAADPMAHLRACATIDGACGAAGMPGQTVA